MGFISFVGTELDIRCLLLDLQGTVLCCEKLRSWAENWRQSVASSLLRSKNKKLALQVSVVPRRWKTAEELYNDWIHFKPYTITKDFEIGISPDNLTVRKERPWYQDATIHASTGALSINLTHLLKFSSSPKPVASSETLHAVAFEVRTEQCRPYLFTQDFAMDQLIDPRRDHLFILDEGNSSCSYLVMRKSGAPRMFRIVGCCYDVFSLAPYQY
jgi:hypothetical protein